MSDLAAATQSDIVPLAFSLFASNTADSDTITLPGSLQDGDVGIFFDSAVGGAAVDGTFATNPAGWVALLDQYFNGGGGGGANQHNRVFAKVLTAAESGATITGSNYAATGGVRRKIVAVFRGNRPVKNGAIGGVQYQASAGTPTDITLEKTAAGPGTKIALAGFRSNGTVSRTTTPGSSGNISPAATLVLDYFFFPRNSVQDILLQMTDAGASNAQWGAYLTLYW